MWGKYYFCHELWKGRPEYERMETKQVGDVAGDCEFCGATRDVGIPALYRWRFGQLIGIAISSGVMAVVSMIRSETIRWQDSHMRRIDNTSKVLSFYNNEIRKLVLEFMQKFTSEKAKLSNTLMPDPRRENWSWVWGDFGSPLWVGHNIALIRSPCVATKTKELLVSGWNFSRCCVRTQTIIACQRLSVRNSTAKTALDIAESWLSNWHN